jgi:hypothetical protein
MPGLLQDTLHQGYGYLDPYVEKARNAVPLIDKSLRKAEEIVPPLITRADELAEPRIEQVKEVVTPYVDEGVKKYEVLREEGVKYYNAGVGRVEQIKEFKENKVEQMKEFKEIKVTQLREFTEPKVLQLREFTEPKVEKIRDVVEPKVTASLEKVETLMDKYLPLSEEQKQDNGNIDGNLKSNLTRSFVNIKNRLLFAYTMKVEMLLAYVNPKRFNADVGERVANMKCILVSKMGTCRERGAELLESSKEASVQKLAPWIGSLTETSLFKKAVQLAVLGSEKTFGKEKTTTILSKVDSWIPVGWKSDRNTPQVPKSPIKEISSEPDLYGKDSAREGKMRKRPAPAPSPGIHWG